jgi:hypothetical protein
MTGSIVNQKNDALDKISSIAFGTTESFTDPFKILSSTTAAAAEP